MATIRRASARTLFQRNPLMMASDVSQMATLRNEEHPSTVRLVSVIIPVKDEAATIGTLLRALLEQTYAPSEIVITDGGSQDRTGEIVRGFQSFSRIPITLIEAGYALPGRGRNLAIARARHDWIATIDSGIHPPPQWLAELVAASGRYPEAGIIYGAAKPATDNYFTECAAITYTPNGGHLSPVIGSALMHRSAWLQAGGFREDLRSGEDLLFFRALKVAGVREGKCDTAVVTWELQASFSATFRRFALYSCNNIRAGLAREWQFNVARLYLVLLVLTVAGLWIWPLLLLPPLILLLRTAKRIFKWFRINAPEKVWRELFSPARIFNVTLIHLVIDAATFYGVWQWLNYNRVTRARYVHEGNHAAPE
jgi:glycosyltransferase involved in cell wall biosynthesis